VFQNITAVLAAAGATFANVVRTTVFLADMNEFAAMNAVYGRFVVDPPPARSTVQVARLPRDVRVEIDVIAVL
jgi:2-iminobutanoate/2-iminopropanoate deaminase